MVLPPFQDLVDAHWQEVARLALALAGPQDGPDCAQRAWEKALAAYPSLRHARNLRGWLFTVLASTVADNSRERARRPVPVARDDLPDLPGPAGTDAGDYDAALWSLVARLPARQRLAIGLRYGLDLDHAEVSRLLSTTPAATRRLVSDALARLRTELNGDSDE